MDNKNFSNNELLDEAKNEISNRFKQLLHILINNTFDYLEKNVSELPEKIKNLRDDPQLKKELTNSFSIQLHEMGLIPKSYSGLSDKLLISNLHQEAYLEGLYIGYILSMMALTDNKVSKDIIISVRDYIRPYLAKNYYENKNDFISKYSDDKYNWIDKE